MLIFECVILYLRTKRTWHPNVQRKTFYSEILDTSLKLRVTTSAMRCIDKAGGLDAYLYHTPDHKLNSRLGVALKQRMYAIVKKYKLQPPRKAKVLPRLPESLQTNTSSAQTISSSVSDG